MPFSENKSNEVFFHYILCSINAIIFRKHLYFISTGNSFYLTGNRNRNALYLIVNDVFPCIDLRLAGPTNPKALNCNPSSSCATARRRLTPSTPATSSTARPCPQKTRRLSGLQILKKEKASSRPLRLRMRTA